MMKLLIISNSKGYTIIEILVAIIVLGLLVSFTSAFFNHIYKYPKILLSGEALFLAEQEIQNSISRKVYTDSLYFSERRNLRIHRKIHADKNLLNITVIVTSITGREKIITLTAGYSK